MLEGQVAVLSSGALRLRRGAVGLAGAAAERDVPRRPALVPALSGPGAAGLSGQEHDSLGPGGAFGAVAQAGRRRQHRPGGAGRRREPPLQRSVPEHPRCLRGARAARDLGYGQLVDQESELVGELFESVFEHQRFTGRSGPSTATRGSAASTGTWSASCCSRFRKSCLAAAARQDEAFGELAEWYYDVRAGLGFNKTPEVYGAFPTDPYSHTPGFAGARQPGMTGQVKEEILTRLGELGLSVRDGRGEFQPRPSAQKRVPGRPGVIRVLRRCRAASDAGAGSADARLHLLPGSDRLPVVRRAEADATSLRRHEPATWKELFWTGPRVARSSHDRARSCASRCHSLPGWRTIWRQQVRAGSTVGEAWIMNENVEASYRS